MAPLERDYPGFWGEPTATLDWCEANYEVSYYIAEFWNTFSNIALILPPALGAYYGVKEKHEQRFIFSHLALCVVGIGSSLFHSTLLYDMQLMDELPMVWGTGFLVFCLYEMLTPPKVINKKLTVFLVMYCLTVTIVYLIVKHPVFHQVCYGLMVASLFYPSIKLMRTYPGYLFILGCGIYAFGFFVWNIDNIYCSELRDLRSNLHPIFAPLTQLHGWWHVLAGLGTYNHLIFTMETRLLVLKEGYQKKKFFGVLPFPSKSRRRDPATHHC